MSSIEARYHTVLAALDAAVVIHAPDTSILDANNRARELLGITELDGRLATDPNWEFMDEELQALPLARFPVLQILSGQPVRRQLVVVRRPDSSVVWVEVNASSHQNDSGELLEVVVTFIDVTERELRHRNSLELAEELARLSLTDSLTGLGNRRGILQAAEQARASALRHGDALTILMADLDGLKQANDEHGHRCGDDLLVEAARLLRSELRPEDLAGRIGGDEFLIILPRTDAAGARHAADRIQGVTRCVTSDDVSLSLSIGGATMRPSESVAQLMHRADQALYRAKSLGAAVAVLDEESE